MLIAHDLGTSGNKASLHSLDGRLVAATTHSYPTNHADGAHAEQDPEHWWRAVVSATRDLLSSTGTDVRKIEGICISGHMMGLVTLGNTGEVLRPAMIWADQRSEQEATELARAVGADELYRITGHRVGATYTLPKLMWVQRNEPDVYHRIAKICVAKDYVNWKLTGVLATDHTDASSMGAYDLESHTWSQPILKAAGTDCSLFPDIVGSTEQLGELTKAAADEIGLPVGVRVVTGAGDGPAASVGAGCINPSDPVYACLGTSAWAASASDHPARDPERRSFTFAGVRSGEYSHFATTQNGGGALEWLASILFETSQGDPVGSLLGIAKSVATRGDSPIFLPYLLGERSPWWSDTLSGAFLGLKRHHARADIARAAIEGLTLNLRLCVESVADGRDLGAGIEVIGGGARSDVWLALLADALGVPVHRRSVSTSGNSLGAAVIGLTGLGHLKLEDAHALSAVERTFEPDLSRHELLTTRLEHLTSAVQLLDPWDARRAAVLTGQVG